MHIAHAIMLFSSLEAVKAGKEKAIQIRGGEKGDFFSTTILCAYCILPIMVARKGYLSGFSSCLLCTTFLRQFSFLEKLKY